MIHRTYAGIGSRRATTIVLEAMDKIGQRMAEKRWMLSTGNCIGPDQAFAKGANRISPHKVSLWLPWPSYELAAIAEDNIVHHKPSQAAEDLASKHHPQWDLCTQGTKKLHARNMHVILGQDLNAPVDLIICWTPHGQLIGGTSQAIRAANAFQIPVYNLAIQSHLEHLMSDILYKIG